MKSTEVVEVNNLCFIEFIINHKDIIWTCY